MATRPTGITPSDLEHIIVPSQPQVSPDGTSVLFTRKQAGPKNTMPTNLWVVPVADMRMAREHMKRLISARCGAAP